MIYCLAVLEYLRSWYLLQSRSEKLMLPETKKIFAHVKSYLQEPEQDALPYFLHGKLLCEKHFVRRTERKTDRL